MQGQREDLARIHEFTTVRAHIDQLSYPVHACDEFMLMNHDDHGTMNRYRHHTTTIRKACIVDDVEIIVIAARTMTVLRYCCKPTSFRHWVA